MLIPKEHGSLQDISFDYVNCFYGDKLSSKGREQAFLAFHLLLKNGWTIKEMYYIINEYISIQLEQGTLQMDLDNPDRDIIKIFSNKKPTAKNLLDPNVTYYHNFLRILPKPSTIELDYNTGSIVVEEVEHFLEYKGSLTLDDICEYFLSKAGMYDSMIAADISRIYGSMKWVYNKYNDAELILYMIDAASIDMLGTDKAKMINPSNIQDYYSEAIRMREFKKNECKTNGDVKVVPRKRLLSNRSWLLDRQKEQKVL